MRLKNNTVHCLKNKLKLNNGHKRVYRLVSNIRRSFVGDKIVDHSDVVGASPVGSAPSPSSFST